MFAVIETKGATHIAIHIPTEGAEKSLPALARMLEHNATFIQRSWKDINLVTPTMTITLGDTYRVDDSDTGELVVKASQEILGEDFSIAEPERFISNKKAIAKKDEEIKRIQAELSHVKEQLRAANDRLTARDED